VAEDVFPSPTGFDRDVLPKRFPKEYIIRNMVEPFEVLIGVALTIAGRAMACVIAAGALRGRS
jgi:hypothetical protein